MKAPLLLVKLISFFYYFKAEDDLDNWLDSMWDLLNSVSMPFCLNAITVNVMLNVIVPFAISLKWHIRRVECRCTECNTDLFFMSLVQICRQRKRAKEKEKFKNNFAYLSRVLHFLLSLKCIL